MVKWPVSVIIAPPNKKLRLLMIMLLSFCTK